jgi:TolB-like protein/tetratricopeptide (TPR) repeat protein
MDDARPVTVRTEARRAPLLQRLRERGVLRVAASYAVIAWLLLQIASVVFDPLGVPRWVMTALILAAAAGFPVALALAWFLEIGDDGIEVDVASDGRTRPRVADWRHYADMIVIAILLTVVAVLLVRQSGLGRPKAPANPAIAVLPFRNLSGDPEQDYFSDGLAEDMLDRLGQVPGLKVIARSSSFGFRGHDVDVKEVAARLGVSTVLEGSVRRDGRRLKLSARLIDGASGRQVWSGSFDREVNDVFAVQAELASAVVEAIVPAARGDSVAAPTTAPPTNNLDAYDLYLLARTQVALRTPSSCLKSVSLAEQAVSIDPKFARAHALLAQSLLFTRMFEFDPRRSQEYLDRAEASIYKALALDPKLSEAYDAQGNLLRDTGRPGVEEAYKRAIELNPNNASAWHDYAVYLGNSASRQAESRRATERSLALDPRQPITWANYLMSVVPEGRKHFEEEYARAVRMVGDMPGALLRFPHPSWAVDRAAFRRELIADIDKAHGDGSALDSLTMPRAAIIGFPVEVLRAGLAKRITQGDDALPVLLNYYRAWQPVDLEKAARFVAGDPGVHHGVDYGIVCLILQTETAGLALDWRRLDRIMLDLQSRVGKDNQQVNSVNAFWLAVQGRYRDAAAALARAEPLLAEEPPPVLGGDTNWGQMETIKLLIYRGTGRKVEADRLASQWLPQMRAQWRKSQKTCDWDGFMSAPMRYAALAASEGLRDEAVKALQTAMRCGDLPFGFFPQLPWFKNLEGYAPYDALLQQRAARVEGIRVELDRLQASAGARMPSDQVAAQSSATR